MILNFIRHITPKPLKSVYHFIMAFLGALAYGFPSRKLHVTGVTGTSGKSTTIYFLTQLLEGLGKRACALSTIEFVLPSGRRLNDKKMTMLGRFFIQRFLRRAVAEGCEYALVETTSEGVVQHRHRFIQYDIGVLTNLYPEHIESHGGFEKYKAAKIAFFKHIARRAAKRVHGKNVSRVLIANCENQYAPEFLQSFSVDRVVCFGGKHQWHCACADTRVVLDGIETGRNGISFKFFGKEVHTYILGEHNADNIAAAVAVLVALGFEEERILKLLPTLKQPPGRLERIEEGQNFHIMIDYAFEPRAMEALYKTVEIVPHKRILHVFGATGGGRDKSRRAILGEFVAQHADVLFLTDEDPYDEDPMSIIEQVARGAFIGGAIEGKNLFKILDRREAIRRALKEAHAGDLVLITGKGSEQAMVVAGGKKVSWDDRAVVRELLRGKMTI